MTSRCSSRATTPADTATRSRFRGPDGAIAVDTGFIVYNEPAYPNLTQLFRHLGVETKPTEMTFAVSIADGALEYAGNDIFTLFAQKKNLFSRRFWSMILDIRRFYAAGARTYRKDGGRDARRLSRRPWLWRALSGGSSLPDGGRDLVASGARRSPTIRRKPSRAFARTTGC